MPKPKPSPTPADAVDAVRIYQVKSSLYECRQTESMTVAVYYAKLCQLWDQLDKLEPLIACTCKKCDCKADEQNLARRESDRLNQFLYGLIPARFKSLRSVLLTQKPLPTVYRAIQLMSQEDRSDGVDTTHPTASTVAAELGSFAVRTDSRPSSTLSRLERQKLTCTHCHRKGHDRSMCFDLLGTRPDWWYELRGLSKPTRGGGRGAGRGGTSVASSSESAAAAAHSHKDDGIASKDSITVYGTPNHTYTGPASPTPATKEEVRRRTSQAEYSKKLLQPRELESNHLWEEVEVLQKELAKIEDEIKAFQSWRSQWGG